MSDYQHNSFAQFDIDVKDNPGIFDPILRDKIKDMAFGLSSTLLCCDSPSIGLKLIVNIGSFKNIAEFKRKYKAGISFLEEKLGVKLDRATSAPNNCMFMPYDPDIKYDPNKKTIPFYEVSFIAEEISHPKRDNNDDDLYYQLCKTAWFVNKLLKAGIDITSTYEAWMKVAFCFACLGESDRELFISVCSLYPGFEKEQCSQRFDKALKEYNGKITIATFYYVCEETYGIEPYPYKPEQVFPPTDKISEIDSETANNTKVQAETAQSISTSKKVIGKNQEDQIGEDDSMILSPLTLTDLTTLPTILNKLTGLFTNPKQQDIVGLSFITWISLYQKQF